LGENLIFTPTLFSVTKGEGEQETGTFQHRAGERKEGEHGKIVSELGSKKGFYW